MLLDIFNILSWVLSALAPPVLMALPGDEEPPAPPPDPGGSDPPDDGTGTGSSGGGGGAPSVSNGSISYLSTDTGARTVKHRITGSYTGNSAAEAVTRRFRSYKDGVRFYNPQFGGGTQSSSGFNSGSASPQDVTCEADNALYSWRAGISTPTYSLIWAGLLYFKSYALAATTSDPVEPTGSNLEATQAYIQCSCYPNTLHSTATIYLQYKETVGGSYANIGATAETGGYDEVTIGRQLTGLTPETSYTVRLVISRDTENETLLVSGETTFVTLASEPDATTSAATNVTAGVAGVPDDGTAKLNGTVDRNTQTDAEWRFAWGTVSGALDQFTTWTATTSEPETVQSSLTGLTESQTYYFELQVRWNSGTETTEGSELSFAVPADPAAVAAQESHVLHYHFERKYGVACDDTNQRKIRFALPDESSTSSDRFITDASPFASGDVKISKDGGALANTANLPTQVTASLPLYELELSAAEMQADDIVISIVDQDGPAFRDVLIEIETEKLWGNVDIDAATGTKADTSAFKVSGYGAGHGIEAIAGSTGRDIDGILGQHISRTGTAQGGGAAYIDLDASASGNDDYYNQAIVMIIGGTGVGQARAIVDYASSNQRCTVDSSWTTNPDATSVFIVMPGPRVWQMYRGELSALPGDTANYGDKLQLILQRFAFKIDQTATVQQLYKADGSTVLASRSVADAAGTQTLGKLS